MGGVYLSKLPSIARLRKEATIKQRTAEAFIITPQPGGAEPD